MLEKIGLPAKPSLGGSSWVVDASHCQGCSSQFTFINRKHHCRRCGGIFCGGCTQNRMVLRGQGDSPVRICEPCKKLEEAARFEMRNRYKSRAAKGRSKLASKHEDEVLEQILGVVQRETSSSKLAPDNNIVRTISSASCSTVQGASFQDAGEILSVQSDDEGDNVHNEMTSVTPEELRLQASNEKKKYKILKGEGKSDEALRAFKRGKELERQAEALEISLRRKRKKDLPSGKDAIEESGRTHKISHKESKEKDDFTAELRALGWSDMDPHDDEKKQPSVSLEGELASLIGKNTKKSSSHVTNKSEIVALKKKALTLKREGKLAEAKEELKRAKILEKQFEEQELLAEAEDSDDELSAIVRAMDDNKEDGMFSQYERSQGLDFDDLLGAHENVSVDGNFEVTDDDMEDPELAATLTSLGWTEDSNLAVKNLHHFSAVNKDALMAEILSLKKEALNQKRAGNVSEAMAQLKKAKLLERSLESFDCQTEYSTPQQTEAIESSAAPQTGEQLLEALRVGDGYVDAEKDMNVKHATRSRLMIQKELLSVKRKALALRIEGRHEEAEEELKKAKTLEHQLEQIEKESNIKSKQENTENKGGELTHGIPSISESLEVTGVDVTDRDLNDPTYLSVLRNLGWNDDDTEIPSSSVHPPKDKDSAEINEASLGQSQSRISVKARTINKGEMQRELLGLKRKALALRRQGNTNEAEEVLEAAKSLEAEMAEIEAPKKRVESSLNDCEVTEPPLEGSVEEDEVDVSEKDMNDPMLLSVLRDIGWKDEDIEPMAVTKKSSRCVNSSPSHFVGDSFNESSFNHSLAEPKSKREIQRELLGLKRKALALRRNGQTEEADDLLKRAMVLEAQMVELEAQKHELSLHAPKEEKSGSLEALTGIEKQRDKSIESVVASVGRSNGGMKSLMDSGKMGTENDFDMLIRKAPPSTEENKLSLKKVDPSSDVGLLADVKRVESTSFVCPPGDSTNIANLLTGNDWTSSQADKPEGKEKLGLKLSSSAEHTQKGISDEHSEVMQSGQKWHRHEDNTNQGHVSKKSQDLVKEEILSHKRKAVALKREGKTAEALEELRQAKLLERSLTSDELPPKASPDNGQVDLVKEQTSRSPAPRPLSGRDRFKLQQESLGHKRQALKLRREGRVQEAEAEFELAKALEAQLEESTSSDSAKPTASMSEDGVEDVLDPQLLSALKSIGLDDAVCTLSQNPETPVPVKARSAKVENANAERIQLEEQIKAEKVKAVNFKRSGKQKEALDAFRRAKLFEKKLNSMTSS